MDEFDYELTLSDDDIIELNYRTGILIIRKDLLGYCAEGILVLVHFEPDDDGEAYEVVDWTREHIILEVA